LKLDDLIKDHELDRTEKELSKALTLARKEWENIRGSLSLCGDIGDFSKQDFMVGVIQEDVIVRDPKKSPTKSVSLFSPTFYPVYFVKNILAMNDKFPDVGYRSPEALYAYIELANVAARRLGLKGNLAMGFGAGYANVRTGWVAEKGWGEERKFFHDLYFENNPENYDWKPYWDSVRETFKKVFDKFTSWKNDLELYREETKPKAVIKPNIV